MSTATKLNPVSVGDYLESELSSPTKHEYLGGVIYAMAGAKNVHNTIASNIHGALYLRLRGQRCRPCTSDTKIRIHLPTHIRFYYPDASVVCEPNPGDDSFQDNPVVIFEVLSDKTSRIDSEEKRDAYLTIPSLAVYAMVEQDHPAVVVYRRSLKGFERELYEGLDVVLPLKEIGIGLPFGDIYENVGFEPEQTTKEDA